MARGGRIQGASAFTKALKEYGGGKSMEDGLKRVATEQRQQGFQQGVRYALNNLSLLERVIGRPFKR